MPKYGMNVHSLFLMLSAPVADSLPLALRLSLLQLVAVLLGALAGCHAWMRMERVAVPVQVRLLSFEVMLSVVLVAVALLSTLPLGDEPSGAVARAAIMRVVLGGLMLPLVHALRVHVLVRLRRTPSAN